MNAKSLFPNPIFVTRLLHIDPALAEEFKGQKSFLITANFFTDERHSKLAAIARRGCETLIINPVTNYFTYTGYLGRPTYTNLPYAPESPFSRSDLRNLHETNFTEQVLNWQMQKGAGILISPYFFAHDLDDRKYEYNLQLLQHASEFKNKYKKQLWACVNVGLNALIGKNLSDLISDYISSPADGFIILLEGFDDRSATSEKIIQLLSLINRLSKSKDVIVASIGAFGQILPAYGANGFSGGVGWLETFNEKQLQDVELGYPADSVPRAWYYYISEVLSYFRPDDIRLLFDSRKTPKDLIDLLKCNCPICQDGVPEKPLDKKRHFLYRRFREMETILSIVQDIKDIDMIKSRIHDFSLSRLNYAKEIATRIQDEAFITVNLAGINNWIDALTKYPPSRI